MTDTTKLPPLPETRYVIGIESDGYSDARITSRPAWDDDMVRDYGAECRRMALDEAATMLDAWANSAARSDAPIAVFRALADAATRFRSAAAIGAGMAERSQQEGR